MLVLLALAALWAAGAGRALGADPTLGATIEATLYADEDRELSILNRSTTAARFRFLPADGWAVAPDALTLAPQEQAEVTVTAIGVDGSPMAVLVQSVDPPPPGAQASELSLTARLYTERPLDLVPWVAAALLIAVVGVSIWLTWRGPRRRNHLRTGIGA